MRQIKFRGLRTDGKGWVYGYIDYNEHNNIAVIHSNADTTQVIPESVEQFTGKYTKSGKEIFEGDKLQQTKDSYWVVKWSESDCGWKCYQYVFSKDDDEEYSWKKSDTYPLGHSLIGLLTYNYEVIGNIHTQDGGQEG